MVKMVQERNLADLRVPQSNSQCQKIVVQYLQDLQGEQNMLLKDFMPSQIIFQLQRLQIVLNVKEFR